jgi:hypothetical protein
MAVAAQHAAFPMRIGRSPTNVWIVPVLDSGVADIHDKRPRPIVKS